MRWARALCLLCLLPTGGTAKEFACASWQPGGADLPEIEALSLTRNMMILQRNGAAETLRMVRATLRLRVYLEDDAVWTVYAAPDAPDNIAVQVIRHDPVRPTLHQTTCGVQK